MTDATPPAVPPSETTVPPSSPAPRKKRRWVLKTLAALVVLGVLLVLLLPTIAGLSPVRSLVVGKAQAFIPHGKLVVGDYSLGWFSPIKASGVRLLDEQGNVVVEANAFRTNLTLLQAVRQKFDLSGTVVDAAAHLVVYPDHHTNLQHVLGLDPQPPAATEPAAKHPEPAKPAAKAEPSKLPDVRGDFTLKLAGDATLLDAQNQPAAKLILQPGSGGTIRIPDINSPIDADLQFLYSAGPNAKTGSVGIKATVDAVQNNVVVAPTQIAAKLDLPVRDIDLTGLTPLLAIANVKGVTLDGSANGDIAGELKPGQTGGIKGAITVTGFGATAPQLLEPYKAATLNLPLEVSRTAVNGVSRLQLHAGVELPETTLTVTGDVPEAAIEKLSDGQMAGDTGAVGVTLAADLKKLAAALPKTLRVPADLTVQQGALACDVTATLRPSDVQAHVKTDVAAVGTRGGKAVKIEPITFTSDATLTDLKNVTPGLRDLVASFTSAFAEFEAKGASVAAVQGGGHADLAKAQQQIEQFVDLGGLQMAGEAAFKLASQTAATDASARHADLSADLTRLHLVLPQKPAVDLASAKLTAAADLVIDADGTTPTQVRTATANVVANATADRPLLDLAATADGVDLATTTIGKLTVAKLSVPSLPQLQAFAGPFVPALKQQGDVTGGALTLTADVSGLNYKTYTLDLKKAEGSLAKLHVVRDGKTVLDDTVTFNAAANVTADRLTADVNAAGGFFSLAAKNVDCRKPAEGVPAFKLLKHGRHQLRRQRPGSGSGDAVGPRAGREAAGERGRRGHADGERQRRHRGDQLHRRPAGRVERQGPVVRVRHRQAGVAAAERQLRRREGR